MTDNSEIIDLLTAIVSTIESQDKQAQSAKAELLEQLKVIASKTDVVSTNFPKLIETLSNFDSKIASSFDDIQNVSKQLDSVVQQVSIAEQAILSVQQQAHNLRLDDTLKTIYDADQTAQQLNRHLNSSSTTYVENMSAATNIAINQINKLKNEVSTIADSFAQIVSTDISNKIVSDVSSKLTQQLIHQIQSEIDASAKQTVNTLATRTFEQLDTTLNNSKHTIEANSRAFEKSVIDTFKQDIQTVKSLSQQLNETAEQSNTLYLEREQAYQAHVLKEKKETKKNWLMLLLGGWLIFSLTMMATAMMTSKSAESIVDQALQYKQMQQNFVRNGFAHMPNDQCKSYMPTQQVGQNRAIDFCYFSKKPSYVIDTSRGTLNIITR